MIIGVVLGLVGATVVLITGGEAWRAWSLALASALVGALAAQLYYEVALEPPPHNGFEPGPVAFGALYAFGSSAPFVVAGALAAGVSLALTAALGRRRERDRSGSPSASHP